MLFNISANIPKLICPEKTNLLNFEKTFFCKNKHNLLQENVKDSHTKDTKKLE